MPIDYSCQTGKKIATKGHHKFCVDMVDVVYIQCHGNLATLFLNDNRQVHEIKTLAAFEEDLYSMGFIRICRNTIINTKYISKLTTRQGKRVVHLGKIELNVSKRKLGVLKEVLFGKTALNKRGILSAI